MKTLINPLDAAYVVVDTESTGLDPITDVVLEVGVTITDRWLDPLAANSWLVKDADWEERFAEANYVVRRMHMESGLIADLRALPESYYFDHHRLGNQLGLYNSNFVSLSIWEWLTEICGLDAGHFPMTGSSIGSMDRPFWRTHLPVAHGFFTYRNVDVSSVKEICKRANPGLYAEMSAMSQFQKANTKHRVRDDIMATISELRFYYENFFTCNIPEKVSSEAVQLAIPGLDA